VAGTNRPSVVEAFASTGLTSSPGRTWNVMRQAVTTVILGVCLVVSPLALAEATAGDLAGTIGQASRLVEAKSYSQAATLLEDLLHQTYEAMAREARAVGNARDAAHFQDNVAIIDRSRGAHPPLAKAPDANAKLAAPSKPAVAAAKSPDGDSTTITPSPPPNQARSATNHEPTKQSRQEPTPLPEPVTMPLPATSPTKPEPSSLSKPEAAGNPLGPLVGPRDFALGGGVAIDSIKAASEVLDSDATPSGKSDSGTAARGKGSIPNAPPITLEEGDRLFSAGRYDEAGKCYAAMASRNALPGHRKEHWAYCRMVAIARRINLRPQSTTEWEEIASEITNIQRLTPNIWYGEYLRNKVAEASRNPRRPPIKSDALIVRASAPDDTQGKPATESRRFPRLFAKSRAGAAAQPGAAPAAASSSTVAAIPLKLPPASSANDSPSERNRGEASAPMPIGSGAAAGSTLAQDVAPMHAPNETDSAPWQVYETTNFRVFHQDVRLAETAGNAAETVRAAQAKRWASPAAQRPWTPRCDLYLYPSGKAFARETNQPEESPGFSTMMCNGNRVVARRINLRADHPLLVTAILPHEVTHVVLADLFTTQQIPRWADEGIAVLAEPSAEQAIRAAELLEPLESGRVFDVRKLMAMDYPDAKEWSLYYAQSVSLTRFLVEQGPPEQFVQFVQSSQRDGVENALRGTYGFGSLVELQERWTKFARQQRQDVKQASRDINSQPGGTELK
jgi:hypothetical protein